MLHAGLETAGRARGKDRGQAEERAERGGAMRGARQVLAVVLVHVGLRPSLPCDNVLCEVVHD